jgi:predicted trehalose synthase
MRDLDPAALVASLPERRWFAHKHQSLEAVVPRDVTPIPGDPEIALASVETRFAGGATDTYELVLAERGGRVDDALDDEAVALRLATALGRSEEHGGVSFARTDRLPADPGAVRVMRAEQSNTSIVIDDVAMLKWYRRPRAGVQPDLEVTEALARTGFRHVAAPLGVVRRGDTVLAVAHEFLTGAEEAWSVAVDAASGGGFLAEAAEIGEVTARLHAALAAVDDGDFLARPARIQDVDSWIAAVTASLPAELEGRAAALEAAAGRAQKVKEPGMLTRIHGDYHLGQVVRSGGRWVVLDFEGEPSASLSARRQLNSPLHDVAGMVRSFDYAAKVGGADPGWAEKARAAFLDAYRPPAVDAGLVPDDEDFAALLAVFELRKAVYEVGYEAANRPDWVGIPLHAIDRLLED